MTSNFNMTLWTTFLKSLVSEGYCGEVQTEQSVSYLKNVSQFVREIGPVLIPKNTSDILLIVKLANRDKIPLYPFSRGKNWGFGSRLPVTNNSVLVDLSKLNKIREINIEYGYAVVEAGVSQQELALKLKEMKAPFYLDVTGSGTDTSIIGNSLERGIAYNSLRVDMISNLEVVLGDGTFLKTGLGCFGDSEVNNLYPHGVGPGLHHLFFQSNFGIVTAATIKLNRYHSFITDFKISFNDANLSPVFDQIKTLKQIGIIKSICRTGDFARSYETMAPLLTKEYEKIGINMTPSELLTRYKKYNRFEWTCFGKIDGEPEEVEFKKKQIENKLSKLAKVEFYTENKIQRLTKIFYFLKRWDQYCNLKASESLRLLSIGVPTDDALKITFWDQTQIKTQVNFSSDVDDSPIGFLLIVPLCPFKGDHVNNFVLQARTISTKYKVDLGITLNTISDTIIEGVISLKFKSAQSGHQCMLDLYEKFSSLGYWPYRLNIDIMDKFIRPTESFWIVVKKIKSILDPNSIIARERYDSRL